MLVSCSCKRVLHLGKKKTVKDPLIGTKLHNKDKSQPSDVNGRSSMRNKEKGPRSFQINPLGQSGKFMCDVCGIFSSASYNKLLCCARCPVKVNNLALTCSFVVALSLDAGTKNLV